MDSKRGSLISEATPQPTCHNHCPSKLNLKRNLKKYFWPFINIFGLFINIFGLFINIFGLFKNIFGLPNSAAKISFRSLLNDKGRHVTVTINLQISLHWLLFFYFLWRKKRALGRRKGEMCRRFLRSMAGLQ